MSDTQTEWEPSPDQLSYVKAQEAAGFGLSIQRAMEATSLSRTRWYDWTDDPQFIKWYDERADKYFALQRARMVSRLVNSADGNRDVNVQAVKTFLERYDKNYQPSSKRTIEGTVEHTFEEILEQLEEGARLEAEALDKAGPVAAGEDTDGD